MIGNDKRESTSALRYKIEDHQDRTMWNDLVITVDGLPIDINWVGYRRIA